MLRCFFLSVSKKGRMKERSLKFSSSVDQPEVVVSVGDINMERRPGSSCGNMINAESAGPEGVWNLEGGSCQVVNGFQPDLMMMTKLVKKKDRLKKKE